MANIYNEPGSTNVKITLKNNVYSYLNTNIGIAKICLITDQKKFGYSDLLGNLKKCLTDASGSSLTPKNCVFIADSEGSASHSTTFVYNDNKLGVNIEAPQNRAHFHEPSTGNCLIQITNASRGSSDDNDGMTIGIVGDDNVIRTTYGIPIKIQAEDPNNPGTFVDLATFQNIDSNSKNTILNTDLTVNIIPEKSTAASVFLTHEENTIKTRTAAQVRDDIGAAAVSHTLVSHTDWSTYFDQALKTTSTPTFAKLVLGTRPANDHRWTLALDQHNTLYSHPSATLNIMHNLYHDGNNWRYRYGSGSNSGGVITTLAYNQFSVQVADNGIADGIATLTPAIFTNLNGNTAFGKNSFVGGNRLEVEGNTLVNGYIASIYPLSDHSIHYRDVYQYSTKTASLTGTMKFTLPKSWSNTMITFTIKGYDHAPGQGAWECVISGYNYSVTPGWRNCTAEIRGIAPFSQVRLAHDGTKCCLLLGTPNTIWHYPQVAITEVFASYNNASGWGEPYSISFITSEDGITNIVILPVNSGVGADWNALINKPSTFTPSAHNHGTGTTNYIPLFTNGATGAIGNSQLSQNADGVIASKGITANDFLQSNGPLYTGSHIYLLNKAGNGWVDFITRNESGSEVVADLTNVGSITPAGSALKVRGDLFLWNKLQMIDRGGNAWDVIDRVAAADGKGAMLKNIIGLNSLTVHDSGFSKTGGTIGLSASVISLNGIVGINQPSPKNLLHIHDSSESFLQLTTNNTGSGDKYDGFTIGVNSSGDRLIRTNYNKAIKIQSESGTTPGSFVDICSFGLYSDQGTTPRTYFYGDVNIVGQITGGLVVAGDTSITGNFNSRNNIRLLNKAGNGWLNFATRDESGSEAKFNLSNISGLEMEAASPFLTIAPYSNGGIVFNTPSSPSGQHAHWITRSANDGVLKISREVNGEGSLMMAFSPTYNEIMFNSDLYFLNPLVGGSLGLYFRNDSNSKTTLICAGSSYEASYGPSIVLRGNTYSYAPEQGCIKLIPGATANGNIRLEGDTHITGSIKATLKAGTTQAAAGAVAGEFWRRTTDNVLCIGV